MPTHPADPAPGIQANTFPLSGSGSETSIPYQSVAQNRYRYDPERGQLSETHLVSILSLENAILRLL